MKRLIVLLLTVGLLSGCHRADEGETSAKKTKARHTEESPPSDKEQIESEVREGGLKDPGGAKALRDDAAQQQQEQQEQADEANQ